MDWTLDGVELLLGLTRIAVGSGLSVRWGDGRGLRTDDESDWGRRQLGKTSTRMEMDYDKRHMNSFIS